MKRKVAVTIGYAIGFVLGYVFGWALPIGAWLLERAARPFPRPVRAIDALHLASVAFLRERGRDVRLATCYQRMHAVADAMGVPMWEGLAESGWRSPPAFCGRPMELPVRPG